MMASHGAEEGASKVPRDEKNVQTEADIVADRTELVMSNCELARRMLAIVTAVAFGFLLGAGILAMLASGAEPKVAPGTGIESLQCGHQLSSFLQCSQRSSGDLRTCSHIHSVYLGCMSSKKEFFGIAYSTLSTFVVGAILIGTVLVAHIRMGRERSSE